MRRFILTPALFWVSCTVDAPYSGGMIGDFYVPPEADRAIYCKGLAGTPEQRLADCLKVLPETRTSPALNKILERYEKRGGLLSIGANVSVNTMDLNEALTAALLTTDEQSVAKAMRDAGVRSLVVHRDLTQALDRDKRVLARIAYHDHLQWFNLKYVAADLFVYTVRDAPALLQLDTADAMLAGLRARLGGQPYKPVPWAPSAVRIIASARLDGHTLLWRHEVVGVGELAAPVHRDVPGAPVGRKVPIRNPDGSPSGREITKEIVVDAALDRLAAKLRREWERKVEVLGHGQLEDRLDDLRLEINVVMERAPVEPRSRFEIFRLWEMGVDGMIFQQRSPEKGEKLDARFTYMPGAELLTRSQKSADQFLRFAVREGGWSDVRPWEKDRRTRLDLIRTEHFMEARRGGGKAVHLMRGMPEEPMSALTDEAIQDMLIAGGEWWLENQFADGSYDYKYWPTQNRRSNDYNEVRHILAPRDLADTWRYRNDDRYLVGAKKGMDWLTQFEIAAEDPPIGKLPHPPEGTVLFRYPTYALSHVIGKPANQKLGTVAVALLSWVSWAKSTKSHSEDDRIRKMARFVTAMQDKNGRFRPYYVEKGHAYEFNNNDIVPGEAALALGEVAEYFNEPKWLENHMKFIDYYQPWFRQRANRKIATGRWPMAHYGNQDRLDLVQFGPWSVMANKQYNVVMKDERAVDFGLEVADWIIDEYQWREERSPWPDYVGGYYKMDTELPAMQTFCYSEGTAAAYEIAALYRPEVKNKYDRATREAIRFLRVMQYDDTDSYFIPRVDKVRGGIKYTMNENKIRIDYVGHGLSTLSQYLDARAQDPTVQLKIRDPADLIAPAGYKNSVPSQREQQKAPPEILVEEAPQPQ